MASAVHDQSALPAEGADAAIPRLVRRAREGAAVRIPIRSLRMTDSPRLAPRREDHARLLADSDADLPPILVERESMRVIDGIHRVLAAELRGEEEIEARFFEGDAKDAFVLAVHTNVTHGLPLSVAERTAAARRIMESHPQWSDRIIAEAVGLSARTVAGVRRRSTEGSAQSNVRIGKDGRLRPLNGASGRLRAHELLRRRPDTPLREIAQRAGISISTAWDVRARVQRGEDPVPPRQRKAMAAAARSRPGAATLDAVPRQRSAASAVGARGAAPGRTGARQSGIDVLELLRKDPSLRLSTAGRDFLRWFESRLISPHEWRHFIDRVPPHQVGVVVETARKNAELWREFAEQVGTRLALADDLPDGG
ncbi:ParB N-terminal domain-containing protein [Streptomyces sp. PTD5-9]|uniref:ParB N-terminal domain-containing protein n=1 Tax=Streptomyces sp. PTD5-9 TaxID=3120150 RepID=UPI003009556C